MVPSYLEASMEAFSRNQEQLRRAFGGTQALENFEQITRSNMELFERSLRMFTPFAQPTGQSGGEAGGHTGGQSGQHGGQPAAASPLRPAPAEPGQPDQKELSEDLESLQKQLTEMQEQLERLSRSKV
jgi:polyhydroxyalkanoate synthesis regulator protein